MVGQDSTDVSGGEVGDQASLTSFHIDSVIPINFQEEPVLDTFSSTEVCGPMEVSRDVRPPFQIRLGPRAFCRDCTEDLHIPLSCEMKDEPAFKPL